MNTYYIKIVADDYYHKVEVSGNTPCMLEDDIKRTVDKFYGKKKKYTLELTEKQARLLSWGCEQMSRLICGQNNAYRDLFEAAIYKRKDELSKDELRDLVHKSEDFAYEAKLLFWGLGLCSYHGIHYDDTADILWDIYTTIRHQLWQDNPDPNKSKWTVDAFPASQIGVEPLIKVTSKDE